MTRGITHRYLDPLDAVWIAAAERIGLRVVRSEDAFASTDGAGTLHIGTDATLDPDDCLAQMIFHELCHSLVAGRESFAREDWGLDNETDRDLPREQACLRVQAALTAPWGLRWVLAPTTDHRAHYDALPPDPLSPRQHPACIEARRALRRVATDPWSPHLARALEATAAIVHAAVQAGVPAGSLYAVAEPPRGRHPLGFHEALGEGRCGECGWCFRGGRGKPVARCRRAGGARVDPAWPACERFERPGEIDCLSCGACCREAYGAVVLSPRDPMARSHPELVERDGATLFVRRDGDRCAALRVATTFECRIYESRPRTCRDFERAGEHCLTARERVGLS